MNEDKPDTSSNQGDSKFPWYLGLIGMYFIATLFAESRKDCHNNLKNASLLDYGMLALGALKAGRVITLDEVTRPIRSPFVNEVNKDGKTTEEACPDGFRGAVGELLLCSDCMTFWTTVFLTYFYMLAPRYTRILAAPLALAQVGSLINNLNATIEHSNKAS